MEALKNVYKTNKNEIRNRMDKLLPKNKENDIFLFLKE